MISEIQEVQERVWVRHKAGTKIPIKDMNDEHLKSAIVMITRGYDIKGNKISPHYDNQLDYLREEASKRGLIVQELGWDN